MSGTDGTALPARLPLPNAWWWAAGGASAVLLLAWWQPCRALLASWADTNGYYSHGPLALGASAWLLWRDRRQLRPLACSTPSYALGLAGLALSVWILGAGAVEGSHVVQLYAMAVGLAACLAVFAGIRVVGRSAVPLGFLVVFALPLPVLVLDRITLGLRLMAARITFAVLDSLGVPAVLRGATLHFDQGVSVTVDDLCSGLRSLITLLGMATLVAVLQPVPWKRLVILALALPVALGANVARILFLSALGAKGVMLPADGLPHQATGLVSYLVALGLLMLLTRFLPGDAAHECASSGRSRVPGPDRLPAKPAVVAVYALLLVAVVLGLSLQRARPGSSAVTAAIPVRIGDWSGTDLPLSPRVRELLQTDDVVLRLYTREAGDSVELFVLHANAAGIHQPDSCYTLDGYRELERATVPLLTAQGVIQVNRAVIERDQGPRLVYFWHRLGGEHVETFFQLRWRSLVDRTLLFKTDQSASTVRLVTPVLGDVQAAEGRLQAFARGPLETVQRALP